MSGLKQKQSLRQILTPQQVIQASILQLNVFNLEQKILDELESNPVLEQAEIQDDEEVNNSEDEEVDFEEDPDEYEPASIYDNSGKKNRELPVREQLDFAEGLVRQLDNFNLLDWERAIAEDILWKRVQYKLQELDPPGIAAKDLQDCLLIQLKGKEETLEYQIVSEYFDDFANHRYDRLQKYLDISKNSLGEIIEEISNLNPRPGDGKIGIGTETVVPDLLAVKQDAEWGVIVNDSWIPELNLSNEYVTMLNQKDLSRETQKYLKEKYDSASWFIHAIEQRRHTLTTVMEAIIKRQKEFFKGKIELLVPMKLQDIADDIDMDISTISRSTRGKYVDTPYGIFELKSFFTERYKLESGEEVSTKAIKDLLKKLIDDEDKSSPFTDTDLANQLKDEGFPVARRTVAKYREQLHFSVARLRRKLTY